MLIRSLSLTNFRALKRLELELPERMTLFHGENAQGKTSILEAIHFLSLMTSPIASQDREIINFSCLDDQPPVCRLVAEIEKQGQAQRLEVRLILNQVQNGARRLTKEVLLNGVKRRLYDAVGFFNSVLFLPQMTRIIEDGPDERRKYLDQTLSQVYPGYIQALSEYLQGLARRNALIKQLQESGGDEGQLEFWDQLLAEKGALIVQSRQAAVCELNRLVSQQHQNMTASKEMMRLDYLPSFYPGMDDRQPPIISDLFQEITSLPINDLKDAFLAALQSRRREELRRGMTTIGPHRDDLAFIVNDVDLHVYGSRGQIRSAVMSLKLAESLWFREKQGELPVLLLDETLAELDNQRRAKLLAAISDGWQAVFTTADLRLFSSQFISRCEVWEVRSGTVSRVEGAA